MNRFNHFVLGARQISALSVFHQFRHGAARVGQNWSSGRHRLGHRQAKRLLPLRREKKSFGLSDDLHELVVRQPFDMPDPIPVDVRLNLLQEIPFAPRQMRGDLADDQQAGIGFFGDADGLGHAFAWRHSPDCDKKILRLIVERNSLDVDSVIDHRQ